MEKQLLTLWLVLSSQIVLADAAIHKNAIEIYSLHVDCKVTSRYAHTVITSRVVNRANESKEALFEVELPKTAFITNFSMTIDGKTYPGIIKEKVAAQVQYDAAVSQGQSAGLVKSVGRTSEQFHVSVNVEAAGKVTFELTYEELLKRRLGKYELMFKVKPKQLVNHFQIDTHIFEPQGISYLETESTFMTNEMNSAVKKVQHETKAHISFKPTLDQQRKNPELEETLLDGDFLICYDVKRSTVIGDIQIVNGYFVHYFAPSEMPAFPKNVVFVIDKSGSMSGKKIQQTREALEKILEELNPEDYFNLVVFSRKVSKWQSTLLQATEENVESAKKYVQTINAQGATDINDAVLTAIHSLDEATSAELLTENSISMIILLTDGQPTVGETNLKTIQDNIKSDNKGKYFLYCLGFGFDVSYTFLEKMALENGGVARRIYEDSDAALQLQGFFQEVAVPILKEVEMKYPENVVLGITQNSFKLMFEGSEIVVAGKVDHAVDVFPWEVIAKAHGSNLILKDNANVTEKEQVFQHQKYIFGNFIERLWAYLTIQQLLQKSVAAEKEQQKHLEAQALNLSLTFNFVTPLTSMVVTKPEAQEVANKPTEADNDNEDFLQYGTSSRSHGMKMQGLPGIPGFATSYLRISSHAPRGPDVINTAIRHTVSSGKMPGISRYFPRNERRKNHDLNILHFLLQLHGENDPVCLNVNGPPQTSLSLLTDPEKGIQVTGNLGKNRYFTEYEIIYEKLNMEIKVSNEQIILKTNHTTHSFKWINSESVTVEGLRIMLEANKALSLTGPENITIHIPYRPPPFDFLGLYFENSHDFSDQVAGLLGQFFFNTHFEPSVGHRRNILVQGRLYRTVSKKKIDYRPGPTYNFITCWHLDIIP